MKATTRWKHEDTEVLYDLKSKTYNDIVARPPEAVPLILIVLCLPEDEGGWLQATEIQTTLKNCCYWFKPSGGVTPNLG